MVQNLLSLGDKNIELPCYWTTIYLASEDVLYCSRCSAVSLFRWTVRQTTWCCDGWLNLRTLTLSLALLRREKWSWTEIPPLFLQKWNRRLQFPRPPRHRQKIKVAPSRSPWNRSFLFTRLQCGRPVEDWRPIQSCFNLLSAIINSIFISLWINMSNSNILYSIIWFCLLFFIAWPIAWFCAWFWVILIAFESTFRLLASWTIVSPSLFVQMFCVF